MSQSTSEQRVNWQAFECRPDRMTTIAFGPDQILVVPETRDAWTALATVMLAHAYDIRTNDTDSYNCRTIKDGKGKSLHSFGIALDVNASHNPFKHTHDNRAVIFSGKPTQVERDEDVRLGLADTDMTPAMIQDVLAINTTAGQRVFEWGGNWNSIKDAMHFEIDLTPAELARGIDQGSVRQPPPGATWSVPSDAILSVDAKGAEVSALQQALTNHHFPVGRIDGRYGSKTRTAVRAFQAANGLRQSGAADNATLAALGITAQGAVVAGGGVPAGGGGVAAQGGVVPVQGGGVNLQKEEQIVSTLLNAILASGGKPVTPPPSPPPSPPGGLSPDLLAGLLAAVLGRSVSGPEATAKQAKAVQDAVMSPIDKLLGGESMVGKKTALSIIAYAIMAVLQGAQIVPTPPDPGTAATTAQSTVEILNTLIVAFGGLGLLGKVDRAINLVGLAAAEKQGGPPA